MQDLDERKRKILKAIIQTYLKLVNRLVREIISKYTDLNLSSPFEMRCRNSEDLGYIVQPHTSKCAGFHRISVIMIICR